MVVSDSVQASIWRVRTRLGRLQLLKLLQAMVIRGPILWTIVIRLAVVLSRLVC